MDYQAVIDEIYRSYLDVKSEIAHKLDAEIRHPEIVLTLAKNLEILPPSAQVTKITGSKGKGTVTRTITSLLRKVSPIERVGTLISPQEDEHTDRIRVDGLPLTKAELVEVYMGLRPRLLEVQRALPRPMYLSPSGQFLLIALAWFRQMEVRHFVLECGRGAKFDEVGRVQSRVAVVTSILPEHLHNLGPTLTDVAGDKLSISTTADVVVLDPTADQWNERLKIVPKERCRTIDGRAQKSSSALPLWLNKDWLLATAALAAYLGCNAEKFDAFHPDCLESASFFSFSNGATRFYVDGAITSDSLDEAFIARLKQQYGDDLMIVLSVPEDKGFEEMHEWFVTRRITPKHILLNVQDGYLCYEGVRKKYPSDVLFEANGADDIAFRKKLLSETQHCRCVFLAGTQSFVRLCRPLCRTKAEVLGPQVRQ